MADEFTPEASVDFETLAAGMVGAPPPPVNGTPPPPPPQHKAPQGPPPLQQRAAPAGPQTAQQLDPFLALSELVRESNLHGLELINVRNQIKAAQLQSALLFGAALLLAIVVYKYGRPAP